MEHRTDTTREPVAGAPITPEPDTRAVKSVTAVVVTATGLQHLLPGIPVPAVSISEEVDQSRMF